MKYFPIRSRPETWINLDNVISFKIGIYPKDKNTVIKEIMIKTITLDTLISEYTIKEIDYCSIDVEGGEFSIIEDHFELPNCAIARKPMLTVPAS